MQTQDDVALLEVACHYYYCANDFYLETAAERAAIEKLLKGGLLKATGAPRLSTSVTARIVGGPTEPKYKGTEGLRVYIEALRAVPLPVLKWELP